jgi:hypothetical protein
MADSSSKRGNGRKRATGGSTCATDGCGHPREKHSIEGRTCWGETTCPCTAYTATAEEAEAVAAPEPAVNEPTPGGPEIAEPAGVTA